MADPVTNAIAKLDGRNPDNRATDVARLVQVYREYKPGDPRSVRKYGPGDATTVGQPWYTPDIGHQVAALAEGLTVLHNGKSIADMVIELHTKLVTTP